MTALILTVHMSKQFATKRDTVRTRGPIVGGQFARMALIVVGQVLKAVRMKRLW